LHSSVKTDKHSSVFTDEGDGLAQRISLEAGNPEALSIAFKALAHPARVEIVRQLAMRQHCCGGDICDCLPLAQSTISQHLELLKTAGIVEWRQEGTRSIFTLNRKRLDEIRSMLDALANPGGCSLAEPESNTP